MRLAAGRGDGQRDLIQAGGGSLNRHGGRRGWLAGGDRQ
jgi:hypothetical protein